MVGVLDHSLLWVGTAGWGWWWWWWWLLICCFGSSQFRSVRGPWHSGLILYAWSSALPVLRETFLFLSFSWCHVVFLQGRSKRETKKHPQLLLKIFTCQYQSTSTQLCVTHQLVFLYYLSLGTWRSSFRWPTFKFPDPLGSWWETSQGRSLGLAPLESLEPTRSAGSCSNVLGTYQLKPSSTDSDGTRCTASWSF